jgi:hypothetical protein
MTHSDCTMMLAFGSMNGKLHARRSRIFRYFHNGTRRGGLYTIVKTCFL